MKNIVKDSELENVTGGWQYANGTYVNYGSYIMYTVAAGDVLSGIALRFSVSVPEIQGWNNIKDPNVIRAGQVLEIHARVLR
ncbi:MAG: LysM peptidoglycan-binding domain-containing protein [Oscillospiraceae bacterium]|nr:LysM peptidoglycan-binding domain-containing protein [Oscillospiraceae bacterium]